MNKISRKEFFLKTGAALSSLGLISGRHREDKKQEPELRPLGNTGIQVTPLCFGASRTNDERLINYAIDKG
ncbi:MAG TPA: hypothetical protein VJ877_02170, partial [Bacteroidales bacterium]|nr:hypothetical protein [Bacteroidales bacterium]